MKKFLFVLGLLSTSAVAMAIAPTPEISAQKDKEQKRLAMTTIKGEFTIVAPPTADLVKVLEAIQETNTNDTNSMGEWQASFLKNTRRLRDLVETGAIAEASFKIDSSSELVAVK
ncbi:MAG: hypothetical protein P0S95_00505 [Rhabdochlamydiaceae bacterium]|nr:hypothetical protein [Candidatus Amphrikana amoebophyrae]